MELVYVEIILEDGRVCVWSSTRGKMETGGHRWREVFESVKPSGGENARAMIHLVGDDSKVSDDERLNLIDSAKRAGFGVVRVETGGPMPPSEAFELMALPFT